MRRNEIVQEQCARELRCIRVQSKPDLLLRISFACYRLRSTARWTELGLMPDNATPPNSLVGTQNSTAEERQSSCIRRELPTEKSRVLAPSRRNATALPGSHGGIAGERREQRHWRLSRSEKASRRVVCPAGTPAAGYDCMQPKDAGVFV